jgi:hypothetical protein
VWARLPPARAVFGAPLARACTLPALLTLLRACVATGLCLCAHATVHRLTPVSAPPPHTQALLCFAGLADGGLGSAAAAAVVALLRKSPAACVAALTALTSFIRDSGDEALPTEVNLLRAGVADVCAATTVDSEVPVETRRLAAARLSELCLVMPLSETPHAAAAVASVVQALTTILCVCVWV